MLTKSKTSPLFFLQVDQPIVGSLYYLYERQFTCLSSKKLKVFFYLLKRCYIFTQNYKFCVIMHPHF